MPIFTAKEKVIENIIIRHSLRVEEKTGGLDKKRPNLFKGLSLLENSHLFLLFFLKEEPSIFETLSLFLLDLHIV